VTAHPFLSFVYVLANVAISSAYAYLGVMVFRSKRIRLRGTRIGGVGFFAFGSIIRLDAAYNALTNGTLSFDSLDISWYVLGVHVPQVICVWMFITGLQVESASRGVYDAAGARRPDTGNPEEGP
jgi:hypothetical protein